MKFGLRLLTVGILLALMAACSSKPKTDDRVILKAGKLIMTVDELNAVFVNTKFNNPEQEYQQKMTMLEDRLSKMLLSDAGLEEGLGDSVVVDSATVERLMSNALYKQEVTNKLNFSDADLKKFWDKYGGEIKVAHVVVKDKALADSLYNILKKNPERMPELITQYSIDQSNNRNGGIIDSIRFGKMVSEFSEAAFALKSGEISKPVQTSYGWHIIQSIERRKHTAEDFKNDAALIQGVYSNYRRGQLETEIKNKIMRDENFTVDEKVSAMLATKNDSLRAQMSQPGLAILLSPQNLTADEGSQALIKTDGGNLTAKEFLEYIQQRGVSPQFSFRDSEAVKNAAAERLFGVMLKDYTKKANIQKSPDYAKLYQDQVNSTIFQKMRGRIQSGVAVSDSEVKAEYENFISLYTDPAQVRVSEILVASQAEAEDILKNLKNGVPFSSYLNRTIRPGMIEKKGDLGFLGPNVYPPIYNETASLNIGQYGGPVVIGGKFSVFKVTERMAPKPKPLESVSAAIRAKLMKDKNKAALDKWAEERKSKVENFIDLNLLKSTLKTGQLKNAN